MIIKTSYPFMKPPPSARLIRGHRLAQGLAGCWLMNEGGGLQVFDLSEYGNGMNFVNSPIWSPGKFGSSILFDDGSNQYLSKDTPVVTKYPFSIVGWAKIDDLSVSSGLFWVGDKDEENQYCGVFVSLGAGNYLKATAYGGVGNQQVVSTSVGVSVNTWFQFCAVFVSASERHIYINAGSKGSNTNPIDAISGYDKTTIGAFTRDVIFAYTSGLIDHVSIYNRALSAGEIAELYWRPFCMLERRARTALMSGYEVGVPPLLLAGSIAAQSIVTGNTDSIEILQGSLTGQSTSFAEVKSIKAIAGLSEGQSGAAGSLQWLQELTGLVEVHSTVAGKLQWLQELIGSVGAQSSSTGNIISTEILAGLIEAQSSVAGDIIIAGILSLGGSIAAQATLTAKLREINSLSGSLASQSTVAGNLQWLLELAGSIGAQSTVTGNLQWLQELAGLIEAQSSSASNILSTEMLAGLIETQSSIAGVLKTIELLTGEIAAQSSLTGYIQLGEITYKVPIITGTPLVTGDVLRWDGSNWVNFAGLMKTKTFSTAGPTDDLDVTGISTLFLDTASNSITIGGFAGGADGQVLYVVRTSNANNAIIEHNEAEATQKIYLHAGTDETLGTEYGGWVFICHGGTDWHDASHAKHVP